ncbi:MAG: hypothetical protein IJW48_01090 [Clostridia bacterium]|nr:hypothetical protein [Clostridia bacterium]
MKKIIALILALSFVLILAACGGDNEVDMVGDMFEVSRPTKTVTSTSQTTGDIVLEAQYTLTTGIVDGAAASVLITEVDELVSIEDAGASDAVIGSLVTKTELREYVEGKGVRVDGGKWDSTAENFANEAGPMSLTLSSEYIKNFKYENNILRCIVPAENTAEVLGLAEDLSVDVSMEITDDGAVVTSVIISYTLPADTEAQVSETEITIKSFYFYDNQKIEIK